MKQIYALFVSCLFVPAFVAAQSSLGVPLLGQCGGIGYTGPTQCAQPNFPQVVIECKALSTHFSQCQDISDRTCIKVACKCPVGYVTEWYTGPEPTNCRLCKCVRVASSATPTLAPTSTFIGTTKPTPSSSSQVIYPYYPPSPITTSSCPATVCPKTCSSPAGSFSQSSTVLTPGTATVCAQCFCLCPIWDCFCQPPAVFVPVISGACSACTCSTPTQTLLDPTAKPNLAMDQSVITTAFLEAENVVHWHQETQPADIGTTWRKRIAMPEVTQN